MRSQRWCWYPRLPRRGRIRWCVNSCCRRYCHGSPNGGGNGDGRPRGVVRFGVVNDPEAETAPVIKEKLLAASSNQTVRSKSRTGKYSRQIRSPWTDAWESSDAAPDPLPMPLQSLVSEPALSKVAKLAATGHQGARHVATYWVGQGVGMMTQSLSARQVVYDFMEDFLKASERLNGFVDEA